MPRQTWALARTVQCETCPWRVGADLAEIPNYDPELHKELTATIDESDELDIDRPLRVMACHYRQPDNSDTYCIGWLNNQLGGNNLNLRLLLMSCSNVRDIQTIGAQVESFADTFPDI